VTYTYTAILFSHKKNRVTVHATTCIDLENIMLSLRSQTQLPPYCTVMDCPDWQICRIREWMSHRPGLEEGKQGAQKVAWVFPFPLFKRWLGDGFIIQKIKVFEFLGVLRFDLRTLLLLGRHSTTCATPPALFFSGYFGYSVSLFAQDCNPPILCFPPLLGWQTEWSVVHVGVSKSSCEQIGLEGFVPGLQQVCRWH
jgi:hypothetical protein